MDWMGVRVPILVLYPDRHTCMHSTPPPCSAGQLCTLTAFNLSSYLRGERDYLPWAAALNWIHTLGVRLSLTPVYGKYKVLSISHGLFFSCGVTAIFSMLDLSHQLLSDNQWGMGTWEIVFNGYPYRLIAMYVLTWQSGQLIEHRHAWVACVNIMFCPVGLHQLLHHN